MEKEELENIDSPNEELENTDLPNGDQPEDDLEGDEQKEEYTPREKSLYAQLQKAKGLTLVDGKWVKAEVKKEVKKPKTEEVNDAVLSRLETRGVMEADDQNYVLRFAKAEGISPIEALSDPIVIDRMKANEKARTSVDATPRSNNRANTTQDEVAVAVKKYEQSGVLPDGNPALTAKILKRLSGRG